MGSRDFLPIQPDSLAKSIQRVTTRSPPNTSGLRAFGLRHSFVIRAYSFVICPSRRHADSCLPHHLRSGHGAHSQRTMGPLRASESSPQRPPQRRPALSRAIRHPDLRCRGRWKPVEDPKNKPPVDLVIESLHLKGKLQPEAETIRLTGTLTVFSTSEDWAQIELPLVSAAAHSSC